MTTYIPVKLYPAIQAPADFWSKLSERLRHLSQTEVDESRDWNNNSHSASWLHQKTNVPIHVLLAYLGLVGDAREYLRLSPRYPGGCHEHRGSSWVGLIRSVRELTGLGLAPAVAILSHLAMAVHHGEPSIERLRLRHQEFLDAARAYYGPELKITGEIQFELSPFPI